MTPADAARLLTIAAAFDRRTIGEADAIAWADALHDLEPAECAEAIRRHFRDSGEYLMPHHVRGRVLAARRRHAEREHAERLHRELPTHNHAAVHRGYLAARAALDHALERRAIEAPKETA